jgi:hypothetical protein
MSLRGWPVGTTKQFSGTITLNGETPDISGDTVTLRLKEAKEEKDASAVLTKTADVASQGESGIYEFNIAPGDTADITPGAYCYDIEWVTSEDAEYILDSGMLRLEGRVSDPPA